MAISYVGGQAGNRAGSTSTSSVTYALSGGSNTTPQAGDLVIITVVVGSAGRNPACAVTAPATWTAFGQLNASATTQDTSMNVSWKFMGGTPDTTFTLPSTGNTQDGQAYTVQVFRGVDPDNPFNVASTTATGTATGRPDPPSITPTSAGSWVVICAGGGAATGANYTAPTNYTTNFLTSTAVDTNDAMVGSGYRSNWTSGAENPAAYTGGTTNAVDSWAARTIVIQPDQPPTLSGQTVGSLTTTGGTPAVTTDGGDGTAYMVVVANADTPSVAQIKAGQNSSGGAALASANQAVSAAGVQTFSAVTGLTSNTAYDCWFVHTDAAGNDSTAVLADFTTLMAFADVRQAIIDGLDSAQAEVHGWDAERANIPVSAVARTSDTVVTITLPALSAYSITANETITATVPASAIQGGSAPIVATPTFTITNESAAINLAASVSCTASTSAALTTAIRPAASVNCTATTSASLTTAIRPAASVSCTATTSAALTTSITAAATASCTATTSASLTTAITMASSVSGTATINSPALNTSITCAANVSAAVTTSAALTTQITCAASVSGVVTTSAAMQVGNQLDASPASCTASTSAALTTAITMASSVSGTASTSAALTTSITAAASASCTATTSAALTTAITATASVNAVATTSAALTTSITMASSVSGVVTTSANLTVGAGMNATASCTASTSASLTTAITAAASVSCAATTSASLTTAITMASSVSGTATITTPTLNTAITMASAVSGTATTSAALTTAITAAAAVNATATTSASLTTAIRMTASVSGVVTVANATLNVGNQFDASAQCAATTSASLTTAIRMTSSVTGTATVTTPTLNTSIALATTVTGAVASNGVLTTQIRCNGSANCTVTVTAPLTTIKSLDAQVAAAASVVPALLNTQITMAANAAARVDAAADLIIGRHLLTGSIDPTNLQTKSPFGGGISSPIVRGGSFGIRQSYAEAVMADSPTFYLRLSDDTSFARDEVSGNEAFGEYRSQNTTRMVPGGVKDGNSAMRSSDAVPGSTTNSGLWLFGTFSGWFIPGNATFEAWIKPSKVDGIRPLFFGVFLPNVFFGIQDGKLVGATATSTGLTNVTASTSSIPVNAWTHVAWVTDFVFGDDYTGFVSRFYINGQLDATVQSDFYGPVTAQQAYLGVASLGVDSYLFDGDIDEFASYPVSLGDAAILRHYNVGSAPQAVKRGGSVSVIKV